MKVRATITVNNPTGEYDVEWNAGDIDKLFEYIKILRENEPTSTSFVVVMSWVQ